MAMNRTSNEDELAPEMEQESTPDYVTQVERRAFYFGPEHATLFGWLHMPRNKPVNRMGMVLCPPLGSDYLNTYPVLRHLANRLAYHGIPVLRFDYSGMGNSSGFDIDPDRVVSWIGDIQEARAALSRVAGCVEVGLFGVRIGGLLAAKVAHDNELPCLVLWGPVAQGRSYMREMRAIHLTAEGFHTATLGEDGNIEAGGFIYTPQTVKDLSIITLDSLLPKAGRILFAARDDLPRDQVVPESWLNAEQCTLPGFAGMLTSPHDSLYSTPLTALDRLEQWIVDAAQSTSTKNNSHEISKQSASMPHSARFRARPDETQANIRETVFHFGEHLACFAITTEPCSVAQPDSPWIIISGTGADHTAGTNRLSALLSRALAHGGLRCVRFDFPGVGDSIVASSALENKTYQTNNSAEISSLIDAIQQNYGAQKFILMGLCSGAYASFHGGLELQQPIVECMLLNPLVFYWEQSKTLGNPPLIEKSKLQKIEQHNRWAYYLGQMRNFYSWKNLLTGKTDIKALARTILHKGQNASSEYLQTWTGKFAAYNDDPLTHDVRTLVESGRLLTFVFARADQGYGLLMTHAGAIVRYYLRKKRVRIWFVDRTNHVFGSHAPRTELINSVVKHLVRSYVSK